MGEAAPLQLQRATATTDFLIDQNAAHLTTTRVADNNLCNADLRTFLVR